MTYIVCLSTCQSQRLLSWKLTYRHKRWQHAYMFDDFGEPVHKTESFQPVQEVFLHKHVHYIIVINLNLALLCMIYSVLACILNCR